MNYIKRLISAILNVIVVSLIVFLIFELLPGDPVIAKMGTEGNAVIEAQLREQFGLNRPLYIRYLSWLGEALRGNLGFSFSYSNYTVVELIKSRLVTTLSIAIGTLVTVITLSIPLGVWIAKNAEKKYVKFIKILSQIGFSLPNFWVGVILLLIFSLKLKLVPVMGVINWERYPERTIETLILPILSLSIGTIPLVSHYLSNAMKDESKKDYVRLAKSKGLGKGEIFKRHILRNSLISVITILGMITISLVTGTIVIENVFALPGLGTLLMQGINQKDYPLVQGIILYISIAIVFINFVIDTLYSLIDPRIRVRGR
jgi:peptide/nickel transport system permease protein